MLPLTALLAAHMCARHTPRCSIVACLSTALRRCAHKQAARLYLPASFAAHACCAPAQHCRRNAAATLMRAAHTAKLSRTCKNENSSLHSADISLPACATTTLWQPLPVQATLIAALRWRQARDDATARVRLSLSRQVAWISRQHPATWSPPL